MLDGKVPGNVVYCNGFLANKTYIYLVVYPLSNTWQLLSTFLFFDPLIVADGFRAVAE